MSARQASIYLDDIETLETAGELLFKHIENADAIRVLAIALRLREQTGLRNAAVFACSSDDIDESAGMAEVVELHGYSRKTPCA